MCLKFHPYKVKPRFKLIKHDIFYCCQSVIHELIYLQCYDIFSNISHLIARVNIKSEKYQIYRDISSCPNFVHCHVNSNLGDAGMIYIMHTKTTWIQYRQMSKRIIVLIKPATA